LRITEEQKKARDEMVLPYVKIHEKSEPSAESGGKIFYDPDDVDDFDDEDPDDDLDI